MKTCIENEGCEAPSVEILTNDQCYLLENRYASSITIGSGSSSSGLCKDQTSFIINNYPNLKSITIGDYVANNAVKIAFGNCPKLETIVVGNAEGNSFKKSSSTLIFDSKCNNNTKITRSS